MSDPIVAVPAELSTDELIQWHTEQLEAAKQKKEAEAVWPKKGDTYYVVRENLDGTFFASGPQTVRTEWHAAEVKRGRAYRAKEAANWEAQRRDLCRPHGPMPDASSKVFWVSTPNYSYPLEDASFGEQTWVIAKSAWHAGQLVTSRELADEWGPKWREFLSLEVPQEIKEGRR